MSEKTIDDIRDKLFSVLDELTDKEKPMEIERAKVFCEVAQTIINTAKVEVEAMRLGKHGASKFLKIDVPIPKPETLKIGQNGATSRVGNITTHLLGK